ncbi:hypothetical protein GIB67_006068 [Kingdonia uniflora]|uniref:Protein OBERON 3 n=1 Tax=Kingdonia uniflora TaxID=39325 RepID=A0A7J7LPI3_9MAGN|nr:hypothetical protein GIB67_006068 [Kingdonia uniflora]
MYTENNDCSNNFSNGVETNQNIDDPDRKIGFPEKGTYFLRESEMGHDGLCLKPSRNGNLGYQELTLSYLCDNNNNNQSKMEFGEKEMLYSGKNFLGSLENGRFCGSSSSNKGKEVVLDSGEGNEEEKWVERDFLQLNGVSNGGGTASGKRENEGEREQREKKPKLEGTLNLSLSLPDVSLSLKTDNHQPPVIYKPSRSNQSLAPSKTGSSDDFTAAYSYSHNPSCSLTRNNSTEYYEYSGSYRRETGEGTNGSVHSRFNFKPVGDGVVFGHPVSKDSFNSFYRTTTGSENQSFFPSELPARPNIDTKVERSDGGGGRGRKLTRPERILREVVSESVPIMAQIFEEISSETIESTKEYLEDLIGAMPEKKSEELVGLQNRLERRSDLTLETLSKCHKDQLSILVSIKTGLNYLMWKNQNRFPSAELVEIFLLLRCQNINCKSLLPVDDCDCKICSTKKGFCSACMCPVCLKFDCASNTCSWVGCDVCSHWCHAVCGIQKNLIKPGPSLRGPTGTKEMQFHCPGCGHASEMFGFVKDVFMCCAKDWGLETLIKELDCVRKVFRGSEDSKGKQLQNMAEEKLAKLQNMILSPSDACNAILQFFKCYINMNISWGTSDNVKLRSITNIIGIYASNLNFELLWLYHMKSANTNFHRDIYKTDGRPELSCTTSSSKDLVETTQINQRGVAAPAPSSTFLSPKSITYNTSSSNVTRDKNDVKFSLSDRTVEDELKFSMISNDGFDNLESMVRIKEAEARMFQNKADDARREAEGYRMMAHVRTEKLEEEYTSKLAKLCLKETEERRKKRLEELKVLENSHCDYYNMKIRMQAEIASLLERMEATKQQWV